jgi:hypothetical protein
VDTAAAAHLPDGLREAGLAVSISFLAGAGFAIRFLPVFAGAVSAGAITFIAIFFATIAVFLAISLFTSVFYMGFFFALACCGRRAGFLAFSWRTSKPWQ